MTSPCQIRAKGRTIDFTIDSGAKWVFGRINLSKYGEKQGTEDAPKGCSVLEISIKDILWSGNPAQAEVVQCWLYERRVICTLQTLSTQMLQLSLSNVDGPGESKYCTV